MYMLVDVCCVVEDVGVDFVKILIGCYLVGGVMVCVVELMVEMVGFWLGVKVSGGICIVVDVVVMFNVGVIRLGLFGIWVVFDGFS